MATTREIRHALAERLADIGAVVHTGDYHARKPGEPFDTRAFIVQIVLGPDSEEARDQLDELLDPTGLKALLEADDTLGGLVADLEVVRASGHRLYQTDDGLRLGAEWTVHTRT